MASDSGEENLAMTLSEALDIWVAKHPDKRLWTYLDDRGLETSSSVTYRQLDEKTRALGRALLGGAKGRAPLAVGDRVLLVYPPSLQFVLAFVACLRVGLVAVPVYPPDPRKLRKDVQAFSRTAASCGATVALTSSAYDHVKKASAIKARLTGDDSRWPEGLQWLVTDKALPDPASSRTGTNSSAVSDEATAKGTAGGRLTRSSLAFLQYTSGSTGDPKGVKITHGNLAHNLGAIIAELKAGEDTVVVSWLPQYHDMGLIGSLLGILYCGGTGYYMSPLDFVRSPTTWIIAVGRYRGTHLQAPNFGFALCARKWKALKAQPAVDLSSVVHLINAAEPIDAASMEDFEDTFRPYGLRDAVIKPTYGLAEHTVFVCSGGEQRLTVDRRSLEVDKEVRLFSGDTEASSKDSPSSSSYSVAWCKLVGCGYPSRVAGLELLVVEPSSNRPLPEDRVGEVWLRSPSKAYGYWGLPERSRQAFCAVPALAESNDATICAKPQEKEPGADDGAAAAAAAAEKTDGEKQGEEKEASLEGAAGQTAPGRGTFPHGNNVDNSNGLEESSPSATAESMALAAPEKGVAPGQGSDGARAQDNKLGGDTGTGISSGSGADESVAAELHSEAEAGGGGDGHAGGRDWSQGFLRTGDEGFMHRGELFICGRIKDLVIIGGRNHYPQDLERTAERDRNDSIRPGCSAAFSVPGGGDKGGELLVLMVELREGQVKVSEEKKRQLAEEIRSSIVSEHGVDVHHLLLLPPRGNIKTTSGKIARQWCRRSFMEDKMKPLLHLKHNADDTDRGNNGNRRAGNAPQNVTGAEAGAAFAAGSGDGREKDGRGMGSSATQLGSTTNMSTLTDDQILTRLQGALAGMGDGSTPDPDVPFYTLGLSSMVAAQFSGLLEQEYGAHVPLAVLDADNTTLRALVPVVRAGDQGPAVVVAGVGSAETMTRETPGRCEETITNSCPCCLCLLSCPCCG